MRNNHDRPEDKDFFFNRYMNTLYIDYFMYNIIKNKREQRGTLFAL
jgi:hypothetical protein